MKEISCDILIIGGGLTGLLSASALFSLNQKIILVDQRPLLHHKNKLDDFRTTAISEGSKIFLDKIGKLSADATSEFSFPRDLR